MADGGRGSSGAAVAAVAVVAMMATGVVAVVVARATYIDGWNLPVGARVQLLLSHEPKLHRRMGIVAAAAFAPPNQIKIGLRAMAKISKTSLDFDFAPVVQHPLFLLHQTCNSTLKYISKEIEVAWIKKLLIHMQLRTYVCTTCIVRYCVQFRIIAAAKIS